MSTSAQQKAETGDVARLRIGDQQIDLPTMVGTECEHAVDISKLRAQTGYITLDDGYGNTGATTSSITYLDGEQGILRYRGYPIEVLAEKCGFIEVAWLLIYGELPNKTQLEHFRESSASAHDDSRGHALVLQRLSARRASDGSAQLGGRRPVDVLPGFAQSARSASGGNLGPPADGQAADHRLLRLQEIDRAAVHLSAK